MVIPTHGRPRLVVRAVGSALAQTLRDIEVIVVLDGPDEATVQALATIHDPRLRVEALPEALGTSAARNRGVAVARAPWVALLDDDDEWMPCKLALQLDTAENSTNPRCIVACRFLAQDGSRQHVWPRRTPRPGEPLGDYLFVRGSLFFGEGMVLPITWLTGRALLREVPFSPQMVRCEDVDWLLRATHSGANVVFVPTLEPLAVWHRRPRPLGGANTRRGVSWRLWLSNLDTLRPMMSRRAYSSALLTWYSGSPAASGECKAFWGFLQAAFRYGSPRPLDVLLYLAEWAIPPGVKVTLSMWYERVRSLGAR